MNKRFVKENACEVRRLKYSSLAQTACTQGRPARGTLVSRAVITRDAGATHSPCQTGLPTRPVIAHKTHSPPRTTMQAGQRSRARAPARPICPAAFGARVLPEGKKDCPLGGLGRGPARKADQELEVSVSSRPEQAWWPVFFPVGGRRIAHTLSCSRGGVERWGAKWRARRSTPLSLSLPRYRTHT